MPAITSRLGSEMRMNPHCRYWVAESIWPPLRELPPSLGFRPGGKQGRKAPTDRDQWWVTTQTFRRRCSATRSRGVWRQPLSLSRRAEHAPDLAGDLDVLPGPYDQRRDCRAGSGDVGVAVGARVQGRPDLDAEKPQAAGGRRTNGGRVLADATREHEHVETVHGRRHRCDQPAQAVDVNVEPQLRRLVAGVHTREPPAHVR